MPDSPKRPHRCPFSFECRAWRRSHEVLRCATAHRGQVRDCIGLEMAREIAAEEQRDRDRRARAWDADELDGAFPDPDLDPGW